MLGVSAQDNSGLSLWLLSLGRFARGWFKPGEVVRIPFAVDYSIRFAVASQRSCNCLVWSRRVGGPIEILMATWIITGN